MNNPGAAPSTAFMHGAFTRLRARSHFPWFLLFNIGVLLYLVPPLSLFVFFSLAALLISLRERVAGLFGDDAKRRASVFAAVSLTLALLVLRDPDWLGRAGAIPADFQGSLQAWQITALGLSYCWLRTLYVIFADESLTLYEFARYYFFAPGFLSGPVMTPGQYLEQSPRLRFGDVQAGLSRLALGGVRFLLAVALQQCTSVTDAGAMQHAATSFGIAGLWLMAFVSGLWLYLNFAAFMDVTIGASRLMGIRVPENFNNPFAASDITDFWRRWHITLGLWLRSLVFTPVARGLSRFFPPTSLVVGGVSAMLTMLVCGVWHKPALCYLIWGGLHGAALFLHLCWGKMAAPFLGVAREHPAYRVCCWLLTHAYVAFAWMFFFPAGKTDFALSQLLALRMLGLG